LKKLRNLKRELMKRPRNQRIIIKNNNLNMKKIKEKRLLPLRRKRHLQKREML
jgi:hypothetical protein